MLAASLQVTPCKYDERLSAKRALTQWFMSCFLFAAKSHSSYAVITVSPKPTWMSSCHDVETSRWGP
jgi:hypothetical protein